MKLALSALIVVSMFALACGGDDDTDPFDSPSAGVQPTNAPGADATDGQPSEAPSGSGDSGVGADVGLALVTVGDQSFEFDMSLNCQVLFGAVAGSGTATDGSDVTLDITIVPEDIDTSDIRITDDREERRVVWEADVEAMDQIGGISEGQSQVDEFTIDGASATGTATFIDTFAILLSEPAEPVQGTFSLNCGG